MFIEPVKLTDRTKAEIVEAVERRHSILAHLIQDTHEEDCKCQTCWERFQKEWVKQ